MVDMDDPAGVVASVEELDDLLRRSGDVPRGLRRRMVSDVRAMRGWLLSDGVAAERVRFRVIRCDCCGCLEVTGFGAAAPRVCH